MDKRFWDVSMMYPFRGVLQECCGNTFVALVDLHSRGLFTSSENGTLQFDGGGDKTFLFLSSKRFYSWQKTYGNQQWKTFFSFNLAGQDWTRIPSCENCVEHLSILHILHSQIAIVLCEHFRNVTFIFPKLVLKTQLMGESGALEEKRVDLIRGQPISTSPVLPPPPWIVPKCSLCLTPVRPRLARC